MVEKLISQLRSEDATDRRHAARELAGTDARAIHPLIKALWDENAGVQEAAMAGLGSFEGEEIVWAVLPLLREDAPRRNMALSILARIGDAAVPLMKGQIADKDPDVRKFVVDVFGDIGGDAVQDTLMQALEDENANVRAAAARALGRLRARDAVPALVRRLADEEWVAFGAVEALGTIADEEAVNAIAALLDGPSPTLRAMAIEALGEIRSPLGSPPLFRVLSRVDPAEKQMVARSLVRIGVNDTRELAGVLIELLRTGEAEDRATAIEGLVALRSRRAVPVMLELAGAQDPALPGDDDLLNRLVAALEAIGDERSLVRLVEGGTLGYRAEVAAIDVLGRLESRRAVDVLMTRLKSDKREVRRAAARAEAALGDTEAVPSLLAGLDDSDGHVRRSAAQALGRIGEKKALPVLLGLARREKYPDVLEDVIEAAVRIDPAVLKRLRRSRRTEIRRVAARLARGPALRSLLKDADASVRAAATLSLGANGWPGAPGALADRAADPDTEVRKAAVRSLGRIGDPDCRETLVNCLRDEDMWVRMFAVDALADLEEPAGVAAARELLADASTPVRVAAVRYIGRFGTADDLGPALSDADPQVRREAEANLADLRE